MGLLYQGLRVRLCPNPCDPVTGSQLAPLPDLAYWPCASPNRMSTSHPSMAQLGGDGESGRLAGGRGPDQGRPINHRH